MLIICIISPPTNEIVFLVFRIRQLLFMMQYVVAHLGEKEVLELGASTLVWLLTSWH